MSRKFWGAAGVLSLALMAGAAWAQRGGEIVGRWKVEAVGMNGSNQICDVELKQNESFGSYGASSFGCSGDLFGVSRWRVRGHQVVILGMGDRELAVLTRQGQQLVGTDKSGRPVTFTRAGAPPRLANSTPAWGQPGRPTQSCTIAVDTGRCAQPSSMRAPAPGESIQALADMNLRGRAGGRAIGVVPKGQCLVADDCVRADGSLWCRVDYDGQSGYLRQTDVRDGQRRLLFQYACG